MKRSPTSTLFKLTLAAIWLAGSGSLPAALQPVDLRCEYRVNPLGIDEPQPRLSWRVESTERGQRQTAYRILVASQPELLQREVGDLWDSGRVESPETVHIAYAGRPLHSRQQCHWRVCVWDRNGRSTWSEPARWTMGLLSPQDWQAQFISFRDTTPLHRDRATLFLPPARQYRREFVLSKPVRRATLYATALGIFELYLNGRRVGDAYFAPGWTDYRQRAYYWTWDVTPLLRRGRNAWGAWVADGWYAGYVGFGLLEGIGTERIGRYTYGKTPAWMGQLEVEYTDGSRELIVTDAKSWKVTGEGPIREADFLMGETYDARREQSGWSSPGFNDRAWEPAILAEQNGPVPATFYEFQNPTEPGRGPEIQGRPIDLGFRPPPRLESFPGVPVRVVQELKPVARTEPKPGVYIFNLGQNFAGVVRLQVRGPAGTTVRLRHGEMLHPDGTLMTENLRRARATDTYILRGDPQGEVWSPRFTYHGFQYVEVTGYPGQPPLEAITGLVLHSDTPLTSGFECSDPVLNRLFTNIVWTQRANFVDLPTDCPQRDERLGWTGDAQIYIRTATYNADTAVFYTKWLRELMESQRPSGTFPGYAPFPFQHGWDFGTAWCDAGVICPWTVWWVYNDQRILQRCWPAMTRFLQWRKSTSRNDLGVAHGNDWGDWLNQNEPTPLDFIDTVYYAYSTRLMAEVAQTLGNRRQADEYRALFRRIADAFTRKYVQPDGTLTVDTQTAYALALFTDLIPPAQRPAAAQRLADKIRQAESDTHSGMTTGFLGTRHLLPVLTRFGHHDLALRLFQSRKFPSWGYEVEQGATTIWERWDSYTHERGFQNPAMNSFAHYAFGAVAEWMFRDLAGIDTQAPGFAHLALRPGPPEPDPAAAQPTLSWVRAHYDSIRGRITSHWRIQDGWFEWDVTIPANVTATLYLPVWDRTSPTESGRPLRDAPGLKLIGLQDGRAVLSAESGTYRFRCRWTP